MPLCRGCRTSVNGKQYKRRLLGFNQWKSGANQDLGCHSGRAHRGEESDGAGTASIASFAFGWQCALFNSSLRVIIFLRSRFPAGVLIRDRSPRVRVHEVFVRYFSWLADEKIANTPGWSEIRRNPGPTGLLFDSVWARRTPRDASRRR